MQFYLQQVLCVGRGPGLESWDGLQVQRRGHVGASSSSLGEGIVSLWWQHGNEGSLGLVEAFLPQGWKEASSQDSLSSVRTSS